MATFAEKAQEMIGMTPTYDDHQRAAIRAEAKRHATSTWFKTILDHHEAIEAAFQAVKEASNATQRARLQTELAGLLTGHSIAEEAIIYPFMKLEDSASDAKHAYAEQALAKMQMVALDQIKDKMSEEYTNKLEEIHDAVLHHMIEEERDFFPKLQEKATPAQNRKMTQHYADEFSRYMRGEAVVA